jgi:hypothetical protein
MKIIARGKAVEMIKIPYAATRVDSGWTAQVWDAEVTDAPSACFAKARGKRSLCFGVLKASFIRDPRNTAWGGPAAPFKQRLVRSLP